MRARHKPFTWYFPYRDRKKGDGGVIRKDCFECSKMRETLEQIAYVGKARTASAEITEVLDLEMTRGLL